MSDKCLLCRFMSGCVCVAFRSKLKVEDLKERQLMIKDAQWAEDKEAAECRQCNKQFSVSRRRVCHLFLHIFRDGLL